MNGALLDDVRRRLDEFEFKERGGWLRQGKCPSCGKKELYTNAEHPWVVRCGRLNHCGWEGHVKDLYPELFNNWSERVRATAAPEAPTSATAVADAYLQHARGFDLERIRGWYTQESYYDSKIQAGTATVRFALANTWWERLIDNPERFGKKKARFQPGGSYAGTWWSAPHQVLHQASEIWLVEGIFDAISLIHHDVAAVALLSCNNYPEQAMAELEGRCQARRPRLVWALDGDSAGRSYIRKWVARAREAGWDCTAAVIPQQGRSKTDWNDLHLRDRGRDGEQQRLSAEGLKEYRHHGAVLIASTPTEKAMLMYQRNPRSAEFDFEFDRRLYWFKLDIDRYNRALDDIANRDEGLTEAEQRERALSESGGIRPIANCYPKPLYYQANLITDESWYYFRVEFPHGGAAVKNTFSASQVSTASEFKKRLLGIAPGAVFSGTSMMLERMMERQLYNIKRVETIDYIGYSRLHGCYVLGDLAVKDGKIYEINPEDFFDLGQLSVKTLQQSVDLRINRDPSEYTTEWLQHLWVSFGAKGLVALAFWFGSLFAEQIRDEQKSFPFLEVVGEAGAGKSTLIEFLWKLLGRRDYEGFDPSKSSLAARARNFAQVSGLPVVLIESDRERLSDEKTHVKSFDWDELKTAYNGRSVRARGMATSGNETYEPPFRGSIVISQNNEVNASVPILQRIVHLHFDKSGQTPRTREAAGALESMPMESVSGFVLAATKREGKIMSTVLERTPYRERQLQQIPKIKTMRIAKNHGQLMALADALRHVVRLTDEQFEAVEQQIISMAIEREEAISADHPLVQEFWEAYDYLNGIDELDQRLNHSRDPQYIAINLNHFVQVATEARQQIPPIRDLKKVLKASKRHKFDGIRVVNSAIRAQLSGPSTISTSVRCWVFVKGSA